MTRAEKRIALWLQQGARIWSSRRSKSGMAWVSHPNYALPTRVRVSTLERMEEKGIVVNTSDRSPDSDPPDNVWVLAEAVSDA